jgi:Glycosyltransferase family 87
MSLLERRPIFVTLLAALAAASMWIYANRILRAQQIAEAAAHDRPRGNLSDLYPRWLGARELLLHRRNPYHSDVTREIQIGYYGRPIDPSRPNDPKDQQAFAYPLYVVFVLAPTVGLPFVVVQQGFFWLLIALTAASVPLWLRAMGWRWSITGELVWTLLALGCFPAVQGLKLEQLTLLVAALVAASMMAIVERNFVGAGILLAVASIKPQLVWLLAGWLLIWVLGKWGERRSLFWSFLISMAVLFTASEILLPGWIREFRAASAAYFRYTGGGRSVLDVLLTPLWGRILSVIFVSIAFVLLWRVRNADERTLEFQWSLAFVLATTLLVMPTFAPYNQLFLLPGVMLVVHCIRRLRQESAVSRFLLILAGVSVIWPWFAAAALVIAALFLPAETVQRGWAMPLYTSTVIPIVIAGLLLVSRKVLVRPGAAPASVSNGAPRRRFAQQDHG